MIWSPLWVYLGQLDTLIVPKHHLRTAAKADPLCTNVPPTALHSPSRSYIIIPIHLPFYTSSHSQYIPAAHAKDSVKFWCVSVTFGCHLFSLSQMLAKHEEDPANEKHIYFSITVLKPTWLLYVIPFQSNTIRLGVIFSWEYFWFELLFGWQRK